MKKYKLNKGILIAIEGIDGAGKTTQVHRLFDHYTRLGYKIIRLKEPTDGQYGQMIKKLSEKGRNKSPKEEMNLFLKDRIEDCKNNIQPALDRKDLVIIDRYYFSSIAYQGALGLDPAYILEENEKIAIRPDLVVILDCAVNIGLSRITSLRNEVPNHFEKEELLEKTRNIFKTMKAPYIQIIDSTLDEDSVFSHLKNIVNDILLPHTYSVNDQPDLFAVESETNSKVLFSKN